ncbi:RNA polymerase sigma-70 factor (ECF subfamily) [Symbiobacterium terraclitae]|uniref:RNA polymerase sigma factor n=2 Tax=Symbiobacterium terraclitae TaxID=557451 RepID=A0ABS4JXK7_9FIRM|nr:sigma-70 family RNA polymerase sigma factor [Symbiobacterium terraclitae]MBP2019725.1 RNA polymerase sigma-70 factor (ECF subfamily) [Symbiobacterium terraclitae]
MEALYRQYRTMVYQTALILLRDPHRAEDVVQEAFVRAFRSIDRFDPERPFSPWLTRIVINCCRSLRKRDRRWIPYGDMSPAVTMDERFHHAEIHADVWRALIMLPERQREILMLRYFHDFAIPEIGQILGVPAGTVKSRLHQARRRLKELLCNLPSTGEGKGRLINE